MLIKRTVWLLKRRNVQLIFINIKMFLNVPYHSFLNRTFVPLIYFLLFIN